MGQKPIVLRYKQDWCLVERCWHLSIGSCGRESQLGYWSGLGKALLWWVVFWMISNMTFQACEECGLKKGSIEGITANFINLGVLVFGPSVFSWTQCLQSSEWLSRPPRVLLWQGRINEWNWSEPPNNKILEHQNKQRWRVRVSYQNLAIVHSSKATMRGNLEGKSAHSSQSHPAVIRYQKG